MSLINGDTQSGNRPGCWGRTDIYDSENRECRGCGFQSTCQNQVIKTIQSSQQTVPQVSQSPYSPFQQPQQYASPQTAFRLPTPAPFSPPIPSYVPQAPLPAPYAVPTRIPVVPPAPMPQMQAAPMQPQMTQMPMMGAQDFYGRVQDPLFFPVMNAPPFRPQMTGETFGERFLKNLFLDLGTMAAFHVGLALRQMILPPQPKPPEEKVINPLK